MSAEIIYLTAERRLQKRRQQQQPADPAVLMGALVAIGATLFFSLWWRRGIF